MKKQISFIFFQVVLYFIFFKINCMENQNSSFINNNNNFNNTNILSDKLINLYKKQKAEFTNKLDRKRVLLELVTSFLSTKDLPRIIFFGSMFGITKQQAVWISNKLIFYWVMQDRNLPFSDEKNKKLISSLNFIQLCENPPIFNGSPEAKEKLIQALKSTKLYIYLKSFVMDLENCKNKNDIIKLMRAYCRQDFNVILPTGLKSGHKFQEFSPFSTPENDINEPVNASNNYFKLHGEIFEMLRNTCSGMTYQDEKIKEIKDKLDLEIFKQKKFYLVGEYIKDITKKHYQKIIEKNGNLLLKVKQAFKEDEFSLQFADHIASFGRWWPDLFACKAIILKIKIQNQKNNILKNFNS